MILKLMVLPSSMNKSQHKKVLLSIQPHNLLSVEIFFLAYKESPTTSKFRFQLNVFFVPMGVLNLPNNSKKNIFFLLKRILREEEPYLNRIFIPQANKTNTFMILN